MSYWLVKTEPDTYSWETFFKEGKAVWEGVRNFQARNNLKAMKKGDKVLFYHSQTGKEVVGLAEVIKESYPDPTSKEPVWLVVDLKPLEALKRPVTLAEIRKDDRFSQMLLVRHSRLSVMPVSPEHYERILMLANS